MIEIKDKQTCCGCNACGDVCPKGAISFQTDEEGFLYPKVDLAKCVDCGLCEKVCPQLHAEALKHNEWAEPKSLAAVHKNLVIRFDSTSGGAFSALANVIYRKGGFVGGAVWGEDFSIHQVISDKKVDLPRLRSSKYAQSDAQGFYRAVKEAVDTGRPVLVCGTPCQMAALRAFLGKDYDNLWIMDFICRGNNSPLAFRKYLDWWEEKQGKKIVAVKAKNKELGWRKLTTKLTFSDGSVAYDPVEENIFTKGYLSTNAYCRPSCYACVFKGMPRMADITVADCWGAAALLGPEFDQDLGTSLVLLNNAKGEALFQEAAKSMRVKPIDWATVRRGNPMLDASLPPPRCDRKAFFVDLQAGGFDLVASKYIQAPAPKRKPWRRRVKDCLKRMRTMYRCLKRGASLWRTLRVNGLGRFLRGEPLLFVWPGVIIEGLRRITVQGDTTLGCGFYRDAPHATRIGVRKGGLFRLGRGVSFDYGADIEVFSGATLEIGEGSRANLCATIVCGERISLGRGVMCGRHVTIRDNNGGHWMNFPGYKDTKPVTIGDHVWLCEGCTIMPGVTIGAGAVIGAKAVVFNDVPPNTLVMGNPATVVCDKVEWKY